MSRFVDRLLREADLWAEKPPLLCPRTVFFGGGTPTLLPLADMLRLILGLRERFDFSNCVEWTIEANPATVSAEYCRMLVEAGVNRISMGAQSFDPSELALLERHHQPEDVPRSLDIAKSAGIRRLNLDLIYAIPGQTLSAWMNSLERAIALGTDHLSCYGLTYEPNTPLAVRRRLGQFQSVEPELEIDMLRHAAAAGRGGILRLRNQQLRRGPATNAGTISSIGSAAITFRWDPLPRRTSRAGVGETGRTWANGKTPSIGASCRPSRSNLCPRASEPGNWRCSCFGCQRESSIPTLPPAPAMTPRRFFPKSSTAWRPLGC